MPRLRRPLQSGQPTRVRARGAESRDDLGETAPSEPEESREVARSGATYPGHSGQNDSDDRGISPRSGHTRARAFERRTAHRTGGRALARSCARQRCSETHLQVTETGTVVSPRHPSCPPGPCDETVIAAWCEGLRAFEFEGFLALAAAGC